MTVKDLIKGKIENNKIEQISGNLDLNLDKGYEARSSDIRTFDMVQMIEIHPNVDWTDGTCRPAYFGGESVTLYLNERIDIKLLEKSKD